MNRQEKQSFVDEMSEKLRRAKLIVLADYTGIDVESINGLRRQIEKAEDSEVRVVKNTLCSLAISGTEMEKLSPFLKGPTALIIGYRDPVSPSKVLSRFLKENEKLKVKAGYMNGHLLDAEALKSLATMPPREVLLAQLLGTLKAPMSQFVGVLAAVPQQFVGVINSYKDKLEKGESAA